MTNFLYMETLAESKGSGNLPWRLEEGGAQTGGRVAPGYGYWIKCTEDCSLTLNGDCIAPQASLDLGSGWNLVGCWADRMRYYGDPPQVTFAPCGNPATEEVGSRAGLLPNLPDTSYYVIRSFDTRPHTYDPTIPDFVNDLYYVAPGFGFWIKMKADGSFSY